MSQQQDPELYNLWRIRRTICEMLIDRNYIVSTLDLHMSYADFSAQFSTREQAISFLVNRVGNSSDQLMVFCAEEEKLGVKPIKDYVTRMETAHVQRAILVLKRGITPFAKRILTEMNNMQSESKKVIELFESDELLVNITKHIFVPKHQLLTPAEKAELLQKYKLKDTQLPRIQQIDPVARYYGLGKGQVVKIIRPSETAGRYVTYRLVI